ncbi:hypothetical protein [Anaerosinus sp.]|uniref:hypothetical protein n=1 Tax=Selenobaculum sp. TaxID=3074374 RepID=UPI003AB3957E
MTISQILMLLTLLLMVSGRTPIYLTAIVGSSIAAIAAGFPLSGGSDVTVLKLINGGLNPVIADMAGVLLFIGIMEKSGFLDIVIRKIMQVGTNLGGAPGIAAAGTFAAAVIGALTGFTQPAITAVITGPAAIKLGLNPSKVAGLQAHAGHFGNFAGFTHPTQVAVVATAAIGFGAINVVGAIVGLSIIAFSFFRLHRELKSTGFKLTKEQLSEIDAVTSSNSSTSFLTAIVPFLVLCTGFVLGYPVFLMGAVAAILVLVLAKLSLNEGEAAMLQGVTKIATPLIATIGFLFMSGVMNKIGLVSVISDVLGPIVSVAPIQVMLLVSALTGFFTQSNGASAAIVVPFLQVVLATGADPLAAACAAAGGAAIMQYFLTGGPVAALSTVIPVVPGSELKAANRFQRPAMLFGLTVLFVITLFI